MGMDLAKMKTDKSKELDGVWITIQPGVELLLGRWQNSSFQNKLFERMMPYRDAINAGMQDFSMMETIQTQVMAETVFLGHRGLEWDGEPLEDTLENRIMVLTEVSEFRDMVVNKSQQRDHFLSKDIERTVGNSGSSSSGASTTGSTKSGSRHSRKKATKSAPSTNAHASPS